MPDLPAGQPERRVELGAFVMTYRRPEAAMAHVRALLEQTLVPERILVIDNDASPELAARLALVAPGVVEYRAMVRNLGPAGAAAFGLAELSAMAEWVYWGDDDQPPEQPDELQRLVAAGRSTGAGAVAMRGWRWSSRRAALERVPLADRQSDEPVELDATAGSMGLLLRSAAVVEVGLPIEEFFWGYEDIEYVLRLRRQGWRVVAAPGFWSRENVVDPGSSPSRHFLAESGLRRTYFTVRNSLYTVLWLHRQPVAAARLAGRSLGSAAICFRRGARYGAKALWNTCRGLADGVLKRLGGDSL